jgi:toxin secretion/phage lysis holin
MQTLISLGHSLIQFPEIKFAFAIMLATIAWFFDPLYSEALLALFVLVIADFITGVAAAKKEGIPIRSKSVRRTAMKLTAYFFMIAVGHVSEQALPEFAGVLDETITGYLVATELISILENMGRLGYSTPFKLIEKLKSYTQKV